MFEKGDMVFFQFGDSICSGEIIDVQEEYFRIKQKGSFFFGECVKTKNDCFPTEEELTTHIQDMYEKKKEEYKKLIKDKDDLIRFMYSHNVCRAEEYTDWTARAAAEEAATELGVDLYE